MQELFIGLLGAGGLLILLQIFDKYNTSKNQEKLEKRVAEAKQKQANLEGQQAQEDKQAKEKIDAIENEKANKPSLSGLADWFRNRK